MKTRSTLTLVRTLAILTALLTIVLAMTSCPNTLQPDFQESTTQQGEQTIPEGPESGLYYYDNNGTEYTLKLYGGNKFDLFNGENKTGTYTVTADGTLSFTFADAADGTANGNLANGIVTFTYNNSETRFLRKVDYTVTFSTNGGSAIDAMTVTNGKYLNAPADPEKADCVFIGWYADEAYKTPFAFNTTPITANTTLYARWADAVQGATEYTISFVGADVENMTTIGGKLYITPAPQKDGFTFGGWWTSMSDDAEKLTTLHTEDMVFTADTTLYALWIINGDKAPIVDVTVDGVTWDVVNGAIHYPVKITDPYGIVVFEENVTGTSIAYSFTTAGEYKIEVSAYIGGETTVATVRYFTAKGLDRVDGLTVVEYPFFTFNAVPNAEEYILNIVCGNPDHKHDALNIGNTTVYNFAGCDMVEPGISFTVTARAYGYADSVSKTFTYLRKLDVVTGISVSDDILTWNPVENAANYTVEITAGGFTFSTTTKDCSTSLKTFGNGEISVTVKANAKDYVSSEAVSYSYNKVTLASPSNLTVTADTLSWDAVAGENISYIVYINDVAYPVTTNSLNFSEISLSAVAGDILNISIISTNGTSLSVASDSITVNYGVFGGSLDYNKGVLSWSAILGFSGQFEVKVGSNEAFTVDATSTPISFNEGGKVKVAVRFVSNGSYTSEWKEIEVDVYAIIFDTRMGSGVDKVYFATGDYVTLPTETTRVGYTFNNWYNSADVNGKLVTDGVFEDTADVVLYAHWKANTYKVIYTVDETVAEVVNGSTDDVVYDSTFQLATPTSDAGAFIGWYTGPNGSGIKLTDDSGASVVNWTIAADTAIYPMFAKDVLTFEELEDGTWGVKAGTAIDIVSHVVVPQTYQGKPVTVILEDAFYKNFSMRSISIPNTVKVIGVGAFEEARGLKNIEVREIEGAINPIYSSYDGALIKNDMGTVYLEFVPRLKQGTLVIPENVDAIRAKAFNWNIYLEKVIISNGVTRIADQAFYDCANLKEIEFINDGVKPLTIDDGAFVNTPLLEVIKFPARLASISVSTLNAVPSLTTVFVYDGGAYFGSTTDGMLTNGAKDTILYVPTSWKGDVVIPVGVTAIGDSAFANRTGVTSVSIPSWVTSIGKNAFANIPYLTSVTIDGGKFETLTIGEYAFAGCNSLTTLVINGGSTMDYGALVIGDYAFANNSKLTTPQISENANITSIGAYAFNGCSAISEVVIQKTTTTIGDKAYAQCSNISKVSFAEGANVAFGSFVFEGCQKISSVSLPSTVTTFDGSVFAGCNNISEIIVDANNPALTAIDGILYDKDVTTVIYCPKAKVVDFATLPATVTKIGTAAFQANPSITTLVIPARITEIGEMAFQNCIGLTSLVFEGTDVVIGASAFEECRILATVTLPAGLTSVNEKAFYLTALSNVTIPETVTSIGAYAFAKTNIATLTIPASVATIAEGAFSNCAKLTEVTFVEGGTANLQLGTSENTVGVFEGCAAITTVTLPKRIQTIGNRTFYDAKSITSMNIPADASLETIGDYAFYHNMFNAIALPEGLTYIGSYAFSNCQFTTVTIPTTVTEIGDNAFLGCSKLVTATFAEGGKAGLKLNKELFKNCSALTTVTFPARLEETYEMMSTEGGLQLTTFHTLFTGCPNITYLYVEDGGATFDDINGIFCEVNAYGDIARVIFCPVKNPGDENKTVTIPYTVTQIDNGAFNDVSVITKIVFEDTPNWNGRPTLTIGDPSYTGRDTSTKATDDVYPVFRSTSITAISLPVQLKALGYGAFHTLANLTTLTFNTEGAALEFIGQRAIYKNEKLTSLTLPKIAVLSENAVTYNKKLATITLTPGSTFEEIPVYAFYNNQALTSFVIPATVKKIGANAFTCAGSYSTNKMTSATFEEGSQIQYIGDKAFANIPLASFTFPETNAPLTLGSGIFSSCGKLATLNLNSTMKNLLASDGSNLVSGLTALKTVTVPANNPHLVVDAQGVLYSADLTQLIYCPAALTITGTYTVPATVTSIEDDALYKFGKSGGTTTLILPEGLLRIGKNALNGSFLKTITIPASVQEIGASAFASMTVLTTVTFAENSMLVSIGDAAFKSCTKLTAIDIPDGVDEMGTEVFYGCSVLASADLPAALKVLPAKTFYNCKKLATVNLKEGLETIATQAFYSCTVLAKVEFPASLRTIAATAFYACSALTSATFPENSQISDIAAGAFNNCAKLEAFTFPATITVLNANAIANCAGIKTIIVEGPVTSLPENMFRSLSGLETIVLPDTVTTIGASAFRDCASLKNITIPEGVTSIGANAFENCRSLETITLPASLTEIGASAFRGCTALTGIVIGDNVTTIGDYAFENCTALESVVFSSGNKIEMLGSSPYIESAIFRNTKALKTIVLPNTVKVIGANLFEGSGIETIQLSESLTAISEYAFAGCANLKTLTVPASVASVYDYAFLDCTALTNVVFNAGVKSFGTAIFMNCTALESVNIPATVESIAGNIFINCPALTTIDFDNTNPYYVYENGMLMDADKFTLIYYSPALDVATPALPSTIRVFVAGAFYGAQIQSVELASTMTEISDMMFMGCSKLTTITLPLSITKIGDKAFMGCESLTTIVIPETVTEIGEYAFAGCTGLTTVEFAERKTDYSIGAHAFDGAVNLTTMNIPEGLTALTPYMFANTALVEFTLPASVTNLNVEGVFYGSKLVTFKVANKSVNVGNTMGEKFFMNCALLVSAELPDSITRLGEISHPAATTNQTVSKFNTNGPGEVFRGCASLESIDLTNIYWIGAHTFDGCASLTSVTFGRYLSVIGDYAFANCTSLTSVDFTKVEATWKNSKAQQEELGLTYNNLEEYFMCKTEVGQYAFQNCTALTTITFAKSYASTLTWNTLGSGLFDGCTLLTKSGIVNVPSSYWKSSTSYKNLPA